MRLSFQKNLLLCMIVAVVAAMVIVTGVGANGDRSLFRTTSTSSAQQTIACTDKDLQQKNDPSVSPKSMQQVADVSSNNPEFSALQSLIERYGINVTFSTGKSLSVFQDVPFKDMPRYLFCGKQALIRGTFIIYLDQALSRIKNLIEETNKSHDASTLEKSLDQMRTNSTNRYSQIRKELVQIQTRLVKVEQAIAKNKSLEANPSKSLTIPDSILMDGDQAAFLARSHLINQVSQVTPTQDYGDVPPTEPYYNAFKNVVEEYGINVGFPDQTFRGKQPLKRGDFAMYLDEALGRLIEFMVNTNPYQVLRGRIQEVNRQITTNNALNRKEIMQIKTELKILEQKVATTR
jgi:hypothetical protein